MFASVLFHPLINVHLHQQNTVSQVEKRKKKLHSNSRLFVKFITDTICVFDNQVEHSQDELLSSNVGLTEETATEV